MKKLQPPNEQMLAADQKRDDLTGTKNTVPVNELDEVAVALRQLNRRNRGNTFEAGKSRQLATMMGMEQMREAAKLAKTGKLAVMSKQSADLIVAELFLSLHQYVAESA